MSFARTSSSAGVEIPPPDPTVTPEQLIRRATAMRDTLRERQAAYEQAGPILKETNEEFVQVGFYRILQPRCFGGYELERMFLLIEQQCVGLAWDAIELMFRTSGFSSAAKSAVLGRYFRNLAVIRTHLTLQLDHTAGNAARLHFALPPLSRL